jgi:hypothetical protein
LEGASAPSKLSGYELHSLMACVVPRDYKAVITIIVIRIIIIIYGYE